MPQNMISAFLIFNLLWCLISIQTIFKSPVKKNLKKNPLNYVWEKKDVYTA